MSSTSQVTTFSDTSAFRTCSRCSEFISPGCFNKGHAWCRRCCLEYQRAYTRKSKPSSAQNRRSSLRRKFGITPEQYEALYQQQDRACAICRATSNFTFKNLCVDHDHRTGKVRGLLCLNCNTALGQFKDSTDLLVRAVGYLEGFK